MCLLLLVVQDTYVDVLNTSVTHPGMLLNSLYIYAMASEVCKLESAALYIPLFSRTCRFPSKLTMQKVCLKKGDTHSYQMQTIS